MNKAAESETLNADIVACTACPRLRQHCEEIGRVKRRSYASETYWTRPVPNFGDPAARLLIVGLAPAAHGANRTGRMFTGDRSGIWLYRALHRAGFSNQAESCNQQDGLQLRDCHITAICHCAPPANKPDREEIEACAPYLEKTIDILAPKVILCLGSLAWFSIVKLARRRQWISARLKRPKFAHQQTVLTDEGPDLIASYHPSQQNTFTGRLTEPMFDSIFAHIRNMLGN